MKLTPSRVSALLWLGAVAVLVWLVLDPGSPLTWEDEDSVERLSFERACELARARAPGRSVSACRDFQTELEHAQVTLEGNWVVCFLQAGRWFVVDDGPGITCPLGPPMERVRVTDFDAELRIERRWAEQVKVVRESAAVSNLAEKLRQLVRKRRADPSGPAQCPSLPRGQVEAIDADLILATAVGPWHFLSGELINGALDPSNRMERRVELLHGFEKQAGTLLLVDASAKLLPHEREAGRLEATVSLIDWASGKVLCERLVAVTQTPGLQLEHGTVAAPEATPQQVLMMDFKDRVSTALADVAREMSGARLELLDTW